MFLAGGMLATAAVGWGYDDPAAGDLATAGATVGPLSLAMARWTEPEANLRRGSAFTVVGFAWIYAFIVATIPYLLTGTFDSFVNALFESVSGLTTTGSTVLADIEAQGKGILLYRPVHVVVRWRWHRRTHARQPYGVYLVRLGKAAIAEDTLPSPRTR